MKKLISIFLGCMMISCAFTACGKENEEKSNSEDSVSETSADLDEADESSEEISDSDEKDEEEISDNSDDSEVDNDKSLLYGKWLTDYSDQVYINIESDNKASFCTDQDFSAQFSIDSDENFNFGGELITKDDYDFDGEKIVLHFETDNDLTMVKTDLSNNSIFGEYIWESGTAYDAIVSGYNNRADENEQITVNDIKLVMLCEENSTIFTVMLPINIEIDDDSISLGSEMLFDDDGTYVCDYSVSSDELVIVTESGNEMTFRKSE